MSRRSGSKSWPPMSDPCAYCGGVSDTHDHIRSFGEGGLDSWHNRTASCVRCNDRKGRRSVLAFLLGIPDPFHEALLRVPRKDRGRYGVWMTRQRKRDAVKIRRDAAKVVKREKALYPQETKLIAMVRTRVIAKAVAAHRAHLQKPRWTRESA
jgi:hypothetical protein